MWPLGIGQIVGLCDFSSVSVVYWVMHLPTRTHMCVLMGGFVDCPSQDSLKFVHTSCLFTGDRVVSRARHFKKE